MNIQKKIQDFIQLALRSEHKNRIFVDFQRVRKVKLLSSILKTNVEGYTHSLDQSGVIHALKHANLSPSDLLLIPYIINNFDTVKAGFKPNTIIYEKKIVDHYFYVEELRKGRKKLVIKTMYKQKPRNG